MAFPKDAKDTGKVILGLHTLTSELVPNCDRCFVISGRHIRTGEPGWYAFCKKSGKLDSVGPYDTFHKAIRTLTLTKGCDSCDFNRSEGKSSFLSALDEKIEEEISEIFGDKNIYSMLTGPVQAFVRNRKYLDINFRNRFNTRFFTSLPDDCLAVVDSVKPCQNEEQFVMKVQALAGMLDRIEESDVRKLIKTEEKKQMKGSISMLEQILIENVSGYPKYAIRNLKNLMSLRSKMYPAHATSCEILVILQNFGIGKYPLEDWGRGWRKILTLCSNSLGELVKALQ